MDSSIRFQKPVYGINFGHKGHFQNIYHGEESLIERISAAETIRLSPLRVEATRMDGQIRTALAINQAQIFRRIEQRTLLRVLINGEEFVTRLGGDGLLIASNVGSTAYSHSAGGVPLPFGDDLFAFTPINQGKPNIVDPGVLRASDVIDVEVMDPDFRPAKAIADAIVLGLDIKSVRISRANDKSYSLMFDKENSPQSRVLAIQFPGTRASTPA